MNPRSIAGGMLLFVGCASAGGLSRGGAAGAYETDEREERSRADSDRQSKALSEQWAEQERHRLDGFNQYLEDTNRRDESLRARQTQEAREQDDRRALEQRALEERERNEQYRQRQAQIDSDEQRRRQDEADRARQEQERRAQEAQEDDRRRQREEEERRRQEGN